MGSTPIGHPIPPRYPWLNQAASDEAEPRLPEALQPRGVHGDDGASSNSRAILEELRGS